MIFSPDEMIMELERVEIRRRVLQGLRAPPKALTLETPRILEAEKFGQEPIYRDNTMERLLPNTSATFPPYAEFSKPCNNFSSQIKACISSAMSVCGSCVLAINRFYGTILRKWDDENRNASNDGKLLEDERGRKQMNVTSAGTQEKDSNMPSKSTGEFQPLPLQSQKNSCALKRWIWKSPEPKKYIPKTNQAAKSHLFSSKTYLPPTSAVPKLGPQNQASASLLYQAAHPSTFTPPTAHNSTRQLRPQETDYFSPLAQHARRAQAKARALGRARGRGRGRITSLRMPHKGLAAPGRNGGCGRARVGTVLRDGEGRMEGGVVMVQPEDLGTPWSGLETVFEDWEEDDADKDDKTALGEYECSGFEACTGELCLRHGSCVKEAMACMVP